MKTREPPSQIGLVIQYSTTATAAQLRPNAYLTQLYGPPSSVNAPPVSAKIIADGTRNAPARKIAQRSPSGPPDAITPMVSTLITAATMNRTMSPRRSVLINRASCLAASSVNPVAPEGRTLSASSDMTISVV